MGSQFLQEIAVGDSANDFTVVQADTHSLSLSSEWVTLSQREVWICLS